MAGAPGGGAPAPNLLETLRSRDYARLLVLAGVLGVIVSALAYGFLQLVTWLQDKIFTTLPNALGFNGQQMVAAAAAVRRRRAGRADDPLPAGQGRAFAG